VNLLDRLQSWLFGRTAPTGVASGALGYAAGGPTWLDAYHSKRPPTPVELVNAYKAVAYACIQLNAKAVCKVPLRLYARTGAGQRKPRRSWRSVPDVRQRAIRERAHFARSISSNDDIDEVTDHPLLDAIETPNPYFDRPTLVGFMVASLDAVGTAFLAPTRPNDDPGWAAVEIWPLQAQYVFPVKGTADQLLRHWRYFGDTFEPDQLVRIRHVSLRDPYLSAYAPLHACYEQIGLVDYYTASVEGILKGGAMPAGLVGPKDPNIRWGEEERRRLDQDINNRSTGPHKGRFWVTSGAFEVETLSFPPSDLGGLELTKEQRLLVANCFDVPISLLQTEDSNRATARESSHQHQSYAVAPRCALIESALTQQLSRPVDERLFFAFDNPVDRDRDLDAKVFDLAVKNKVMTINEVRAHEGLHDVPWGETPEGVVVGGDDADDAAVKAGAVPAGGVVQDQALNGAQISSMVEIITNIKTGVIPPESAKAMLAAAYPTLSPDDINKIVNPIKVEKPEPAPVPARAPFPPPPHREPDADDRGGKPDGDADDVARSALYARFNSVLDAIEARVS
jgi:phage portal protein BeeE